jgi:hypothetical protein
MGDQHQTHILLMHELPEQIENLRLGGHIERGGRFVGDQDTFGLSAIAWAMTTR